MGWAESCTSKRIVAAFCSPAASYKERTRSIASRASMRSSSGLGILLKSLKRPMMVFRLAISMPRVAVLSRKTSSNSDSGSWRARVRFSTVSWRGKSGFLSSCARRRASSRQAATRSVWTSRSRWPTNWPVMWLKLRASAPTSSRPPSGTRVSQLPPATSSAAAANRSMGPETRAAIQRLHRMAKRIPAAATP